MVEEVADGLEVVGAGDVDGEAAAEEGEELLLHHRGEHAVARDLVRRPPREEPLRDERDLVPARRLDKTTIDYAAAEDLEGLGSGFMDDD